MEKNKKEYERDKLFKIIKDFFGEGSGDSIAFKEDELEIKIEELYGKEFDWSEYSFAIDKPLKKGIINKSIVYYIHE